MEELKEGWKSVKLLDYYEVTNGLSKNKNEFGFGYPFLTFKEVFNNYFLPENLVNLANSTVKEREKCSIKRGDIFITRTSETMEELGITAVALKDYPNATFNGFTKRLRPKSHAEISPEFISFYLKSKEFRNQIQSFSSLTTRASLNNEMLEKLELIIPDIQKQKEIAKILKNLYDKIEINNEMNKTLEEMAQTLFKRWFIDFDFPNENGEPYRSSGGKMVESELGEIPEGWEVSDIYKISNVIYGAAFKSKQFNEEKKGFPLIRIRDLKTFNPQFFTEENHPKKILVHPGDLLVGMDAEFRATPWLGKIGVLNQRVCMFSPNKDVVGKYFLKMILEKPLSFFENSKVATTVIHLGKSDIDMIKIICPNDLILEKFKELTEYIYQKKINNAQEIQSLTEIRDTLLPKLMSGEIDM